MTYNPNIPQATDIPSQSQGQFLTNFGQLNTIFDVDHVPFNDGTAANRGKHDKSTYVEQGADPTTSANEMALYTKDNAGANTLYMRQESNGSVIQMSGAAPTAAINGSTFLPGGLILKWGQVVPNSSPTSVVFPTAFPGNLYSITLTINNNAPGFSATVDGSSNTGFDLYTNKLVATHFYIAIGD
jgi:hypothetical protein